jgi:lipoate-protein ligase A
MALDEVLMAAARRGTLTLRLYGWDPPCLSFGRNQTACGRYDPEKAGRRHIDVVRRPTGGRAVYHHREITYCVAAPVGLWGDLRDGYARINQALGRGLRSLGAPLDEARARQSGRQPRAARGAPSARAPRPLARACFRDPFPGEITSAGRKLIGSAQWRLDGALLQHGSILLEDDQAVVDDLMVEARRRGAWGAAAHTPSTGACSLHELLGELPSEQTVIAALRRGFEEEIDLPSEPDEWTSLEMREARRLVARYEDPEWTWRR